MCQCCSRSHPIGIGFDDMAASYAAKGPIDKPSSDTEIISGDVSMIINWAKVHHIPLHDNRADPEDVSISNVFVVLGSR